MMTFHLRSCAATAAFAVACTGFAVLAGCADPARSRNLGDPSVPALALARQVCSNCHGVTGNATSPNFPNLAAQPAAYLQAQLREFRAHHRQDPAGFEYMWGLSQRLTDTQIDGLADYFSQQTLQPQPPQAAVDRRSAGQAIFENGLPAQGVPACGSCHGAHAEGNATFPRLAGQHADYLVKQLGVFQRTDERPLGAVMRVVAHGLDAESMRNVAAYLQAMRTP
jgi:cytochrome c553